MPKVSIIMPTYKVEKYFRKCLESVINQTLIDIEIIPVDDGSPDNCGKIMDEYALKDSRIKPIHQENSGYGKAVNAGINVATGEYIGIVETDDWCELDMFEKLYNQAKKLDVDVCKCDFNYYYGGNNFSQCKFMREIAKEGEVFTLKENPLIMKNHVSIWSAIYKKSYLDKFNIRVVEAKGACYQDMPFAALAYAKGGKITVLHENLINYRVENGMDSSTIRTDGRLKMMPIMCGIAKQYFIENGCWDAVKEVVYIQFYHASVGMWFQTADQYKLAHFQELFKLFENFKNDNVSLKYFNKKRKKVMQYIINNDYDGLFKYYKFLRIVEKFKKFRQNIISIKLASTEKRVIVLGMKWRLS